MNIIEGKLLAEGQKIAIVAGRFNEIITNKLLGGAIDAFKRHGGDENNIVNNNFFFWQQSITNKSKNNKSP